MQNVIGSSQSNPIPLLVLLAARGFGGPKKQERKPNKIVRKQRGKLVGCATCSGKGMKPCPICKGTKQMSGFLGATVKCVPCDGQGHLGRKCPDCEGMGFTEPK